jgi:hypothetical protein
MLPLSPLRIASHRTRRYYEDVASGPQQSGKGAGTVKRSTPKLKKESLANVMRLKAAMLKRNFARVLS